MSGIASTRRTIRLYRRMFDWLMLVALILAIPLGLRSALGAPAEPGELRDRGGLSLMREDRPDLVVSAPALALASHTRITGPVARTTVEQRFRNAESVWVEALYSFPLPDGAAVDGLTLKIGDRLIEGELKERAAANTAYIQAREEGRKAGMLSQARPNLFTVSIANIPPGEEIAVRLTFQQALAPQDGGYRLELPQTLTHRYRGTDPRLADLARQAAPEPLNDDPALGADYDPTNPPRYDGDQDTGHGVGIAVDLVTGEPLSEIGSPSHELTVLDQGGKRYLVTLQDGETAADRDFVLTWKEREGDMPQATLYLEQTDAGLFGLAELQPPAASALPDPAPRDFVFVVDGSGSMYGPGIVQARRALTRALDLLRPEDAFTIIRFSDDHDLLFRDFRPANEGNLAAGHRFVDRLDADGGTEMLPALNAALALPQRDGRLKQIVFLTDGGVTDEAAMFDAVERKLGEARLFPVAVGAAPNGWFMRRSAEFGRGSVTHVDAEDATDRAIDALMDRIARPALTDLALHVEGGDARFYPERLPDLLAGSPVIVPIRFSGEPGRVVLTGNYAGMPWSGALAIRQVEPGAGLDKLYARAEIETLLDEGRREGDEGLHRDAIVNASLNFNVASPFTRFLAVEKTVSRPAGAEQERRPVPAAAPAGSAPGIMGPQTATPMELLLIIGALATVLAAAAGFWARRSGR